MHKHSGSAKNFIEAMIFYQQFFNRFGTRCKGEKMYIVLLIVCGIESIYDIKIRTIHTLIWILIAVGATIGNVVYYEKDFVWICMGTFVGVFLIGCSKVLRGGIGIGDGIVFLTLGLGLGIKVASCILFYSLVLCCMWSILQLSCKKCSRTDELPFLPFIFVGMIWNQMMLNL